MFGINWGEINDFISVIQSIVVAVVAVIAAFGLNDNVKSRKLTLIREVITEIGTPEIRSIRHQLFDHPSKVSLEDKFKLAVGYDRISFMLYADKKLYNLMIDFQGTEILKVWDALEEDILKKRESQSNPNYCKHFERVALKMKK